MTTLVGPRVCGLICRIVGASPAPPRAACVLSGLSVSLAAARAVCEDVCVLCVSCRWAPVSLTLCRLCRAPGGVARCARCAVRVCERVCAVCGGWGGIAYMPVCVWLFKVLVLGFRGQGQGWGHFFPPQPHYTECPPCSPSSPFALRTLLAHPSRGISPFSAPFPALPPPLPPFFKYFLT
jgi:hypothetical protein